jgi:superfamily II DNA or RNA helicase
VIDLVLTNRKLLIEGIDPETLRDLEEATSYKVAGHWFSPAFKAHRWDGKERLLNYTRKDGYHVPAGLFLDVVRVLKGLGHRLRITRRTHVRHNRVELRWGDVVMRPYQKRATMSVLKCDHVGVGVLKMPIRSGKTKTAGRVIYKIGRPTLFLVPSQMLLHQTVDSLKECFPDQDIGKIGDGEDQQEFITVATIQTLARLRAGTVAKKRRHPRAPKPSPAEVRAEAKRIAKKSREMKLRYKELCEAFDLLIVDEAHHIRGEGDWYKIPYEIDARFKVGLSATAYPENESEAERGIIWMRAIFGPIRIDVSTSELVEQGYLMRQNVRMFRVSTPDMNGMKWSNTLRDRCITRNKRRNRLIVKLAQKYADDGCKVLIVANRTEHISELVNCMDDVGLDHRVIIGRHAREERQEKVEGFVAGEYGVLIGTVLGEGVDIPVCDVVINAEGGKDDKATVQRQRNLTISPGKLRAVLIDFYDETNGYFTKHSKQRLEAYRSEESFDVRVIG